jgi:hypothetical protein
MKADPQTSCACSTCKRRQLCNGAHRRRITEYAEVDGLAKVIGALQDERVGRNGRRTSTGRTSPGSNGNGLSASAPIRIRSGHRRRLPPAARGAGARDGLAQATSVQLRMPARADGEARDGTGRARRGHRRSVGERREATEASATGFVGDLQEEAWRVSSAGARGRPGRTRHALRPDPHAAAVWAPRRCGTAGAAAAAESTPRTGRVKTAAPPDESCVRGMPPHRVRTAESGLLTR